MPAKGPKKTRRGQALPSPPQMMRVTRRSKVSSLTEGESQGYERVAKSNGVVSHTRSVNRTDSDCQKENRQPNVMPQSKRRKKRNSKKIGKLQRLLDSFPLEIMFEICIYIPPRDLLHLSRSSRVFARFLLIPSAEAIWKLSREMHALELPPIYPDLTERKYALLAFGSHCQRCGCITSIPVDWYRRMRWCGKCSDPLPNTYRDFTIPQVAPEHRYRAQFINEMVVHIPCSRQGQAEHPQKHGPRFHVVCLAEEVDLALRVLKTSTDKEWGEFVCQKRRERLAKHDHATQCASWSDQQVSRLKEELRMQRKAAIRQKLKQMGFNEEIVNEVELDRLRTTNKPRPLSNSGWIHMKDRVVALVKEHEEGEKFKYLTYIKGLARDLYTSWYESRDPNGEIWPNPCQFIEFEPVMTILKEVVSLNLEVLVHRSGIPASDLDLEPITGAFQGLASAYSRELSSKLPDSVPKRPPS